MTGDCPVSLTGAPWPPAQAVEDWNRGRWQAAHEGFEALWRAAAPPEEAHDHHGAVHDPVVELWRTLAQAAAVGVLQRQGRRNGARAVASKAAARLRALRDEHGPRLQGLDVAAAAANLLDCVEDAARLAPLVVVRDRA